MESFFSQIELAQVQPPLSRLPACSACGLYRDCQSPKMPAWGKGIKKILVVGEAPGEEEDRQGRPFVGRTGRYLREHLDTLGIDLDRDCWTANSVACHAVGNDVPEKAVDHCRPLLLSTIDDLQPEVILLLGGAAVQSLIGHLWKDDVGGVGRWAGWQIPCQELNAWVCPTWHPSFLMREEMPALTRLFRSHLEAAVTKQGRPWEVVPDYRREVGILLDDKQAAQALEYMTAEARPIAWDLETDRIKPDRRDSRIISCAVSNGTETLAFPWYGRAVSAMRLFLGSIAPKIGWNCKFESRWIRSKLNLWVKNWTWDGMLAAHVLDNRPQISSLKFQAFVRLGQGDYESLVEPYKKSRKQGGNEKNRMAELDLPTMLIYGGLDSLLTWKVAQLQQEEMNRASQ